MFKGVEIHAHLLVRDDAPFSRHVNVPLSGRKCLCAGARCQVKIVIRQSTGVTLMTGAGPLSIPRSVSEMVVCLTLAFGSEGCSKTRKPGQTREGVRVDGFGGRGGSVPRTALWKGRRLRARVRKAIRRRFSSVRRRRWIEDVGLGDQQSTRGSKSAIYEFRTEVDRTGSWRRRRLQ